MAETVVYTRETPGVAVVRLARPEALNALRQTEIDRLGDILRDAAADEELRVLVLTGTGRAFCAGIDLKELGADRSDALNRAHLEATQGLSRALVRHPKIVIAAINGLAIGMGAELAVAADIRIAAEAATFAFPEVKRALFVTNGAMYLLPRLVGLGRAMHWLLTGETITAAQALATGLVTQVVPAAGVLAAALECARTIAANAPISVRLIKQTLRAGHELDFDATLQHEVDGVLACFESEDFREGVRAFMEKRPPRYTGR